jgi:hypothetical protein
VGRIRQAFGLARVRWVIVWTVFGACESSAPRTEAKPIPTVTARPMAPAIAPSHPDANDDGVVLRNGIPSPVLGDTAIAIRDIKAYFLAGHPTEAAVRLRQLAADLEMHARVEPDDLADASGNLRRVAGQLETHSLTGLAELEGALWIAYRAGWRHLATEDLRSTLRQTTVEALTELAEMTGGGRAAPSRNQTLRAAGLVEALSFTVPTEEARRLDRLATSLRGSIDGNMLVAEAQRLARPRRIGSTRGAQAAKSSGPRLPDTVTR